MPRDLKDEFVTVRFAQRDREHLMFRRHDMPDATEEILADNGIAAQALPEFPKNWQSDARE